MKKVVNHGDMVGRFALSFILMGLCKVSGWALVLGLIGNFLWLLIRYETLFAWTLLGYPLIAYVGSMIMLGFTAQSIKENIDMLDNGMADLDLEIEIKHKNGKKEDKESSEEKAEESA